jgi:hypothetical protein
VVGEIFRTRAYRPCGPSSNLSDSEPWGLPTLLCNGQWFSFLEVQRLGCGVEPPLPHLVPSVKKYSCTSTLPLGLSGLFLLAYFKETLFLFV